MSWLTQNSIYVQNFFCEFYKVNLVHVGVLEPALDTILNTKTILELIFIVCHAGFATPTINFDLKF